MTPTLAHNTQGLWDQLPLLSQEMAVAHAELAIAHPHAQAWTHAALRRGASSPAGDDQVFAVELSALALGFEPEDAQCLALAWARQHARTATPQLAWPNDLDDFETQAWTPTAHAPCPHRLGLYVVAPSAEWIARLVDMGVPTVQLRFKSDDPKAIEREVRLAIDHAKGSHSRLFINDFWQLAIELGAYGIHLGQEDVGTADFAAIQASGLRLGLSTHGYCEMLRAARHRPSYLALGAVYATNLKVMPTQPQGPKRLARYAALMQAHFPLVAIGGIDYPRLNEVLPSGVGSVAAVRAILQASDPVQEAQRWMARCPAGE